MSLPSAPSDARERLLRGLFSSAGRADPYPWYARLRNGPSVWRSDSGAVIVSSFEGAAAVVQDPAFAVKDAKWFDVNRPGWRARPGTRLFCSSMLFADGPGHQRVRSVVSAALAPRRMRDLERRIHDLAVRQLDALADHSAHEVVDLRRHFTLSVPLQVACALIGVPPDDGEVVHSWVQPLLALLDPVVNVRSLRHCDAAAVSLAAYLSDLLDARCAQGRPDLATDVARAWSEGRLGRDEAEAALFLAAAAAFETTAVLLENAVSAVCDLPEWIPEITHRPGTAVAAVNETLRYDPPVQLFTRVVREEAVIGGLRLLPGEEVLVLLAAAQRDPARFAHPDDFDLRRPPCGVLSFGGGAHYCLGAALARLEARILLPALLRRFPRLQPAGTPTGNGRITMRGRTDFPVTLAP